MTLKKYLQRMEQFVKQHPEALKMPVVYAIDSEGNAFHEVEDIGGISDFLEDGEKQVCLN